MTQWTCKKCNKKNSGGFLGIGGTSTCEYCGWPKKKPLPAEPTPPEPEQKELTLENLALNQQAIYDLLTRVAHKLEYAPWPDLPDLPQPDEPTPTVKKKKKGETKT